jgi:hypothetical protein
MSEELKLCSFCGKTAYKSQAKRIIHSCNTINVSMSREHWQSRPIEDALQAKLDEAVEALRKYATAGNWNEYTYFDGEYAGGQLAEEALKRIGSKNVQG